MKGAIGTDDIFEDGRPQVVFIGRSNVGKSSVINSLTNQKNLARASSVPGRTQQMNVFLVNKSFYLVDLPGYGFARAPKEVREKIQKMLDWYLFRSDYDFKKVILIVDAKVGPTRDDVEMFNALREADKDIVIVANKVDKVKKSEYAGQLQKIRDIFGSRKVIPYSAEKKTGVGELSGELPK